MSEPTFTFVEPSVTPVLEPDLQRKVERCYRICYKSEKHMKETPDVFLKNIIHHTTGNHHWSPLEHARVEMKASIRIAADLADWERERGTSFLTIKPYPVMCWHNGRKIIPYTDDIHHNTKCNIRGNFRTLLEYISEDGSRDYTDSSWRYFYQHIVSKVLSERYPAVFSPERTEELAKKYDPAKFENENVYFEILGPAIDYRTYHIVTSRDILQELARHRSLSFSVESTRYCNYQKKGIVFCLPRPYEWADELTSTGMSHSESLALTKICKAASETYLSLKIGRASCRERV